MQHPHVSQAAWHGKFSLSLCLLLLIRDQGAMGKRGDPKAVLDSHGRVIGVQGLRVADASAPPLLLPGHPMPTVCKCFPFSFTFPVNSFSWLFAEACM
jgi:hypothetical protein